LLSNEQKLEVSDTTTDAMENQSWYHNYKIKIPL